MSILSGVLSGVMKQAPVLVFDAADVRDVAEMVEEPHEMPDGLSYRYHAHKAPFTEVELTAWRKQVMVFVYDGDQLTSGRLVMDKNNSPMDVVLRRMLKQKAIMFLHVRGDELDTVRVRLTPAGAEALAVWLDKCLELGVL